MRNNLDLLVELLEERKAITSDIDKFSGNYVLSGVELTLDSCSGAPQVAHSSISATAVASNGVLDVTTSENRWTLRDGHLDEAASHVDPDSIALSTASNNS